MKKVFAMLIALTLIVCALSGAFAEEILVVVKNSTAPFWISTMAGAKQAGEDLGYNVTCKTPVDTAEGSGNEQQYNLCEEAITTGVDALVIAPVDSEAIIPAVRTVNDAGIPVINLNTKIADESQYITFCGLENYNVCYSTAQAMFDIMGGEGKIFIIEGSTGAQTSIDRVAGFEAAAAEHEGIEIIAQQSANYSRAEALNVVQNLLQAHPEVEAILCANDEMALGAAEAIDAAGRTGTIKISGVDANDDAIAAMKEGKITVDSFGNPYMQGYLAVAAAVDVLQGKEVDPFYEVEAIVVTMDNVDTFNQ